MSTVAEQLRQAREAQKLTIQELAEITKIRSDHIRALEEGNFNVFSGNLTGFNNTSGSFNAFYGQGAGGNNTTGSNNTSRYFEYYFSKVPHIIRKNRNSLAVLTGNETEAQ